METTFTPLPAELRPVLPTSGGEPLRLVDDQTQRIYLLIEQAPAPTMDDDHIRKLLAEADEDIARGDVAEWDLDEVKAEGRRLLAERSAQRGQ